MNIPPSSPVFIQPPEAAIHLSRMIETLDSMEVYKERSKYDHIFEDLITKNLNANFPNTDPQLEQEIKEISRDFQQLLEKTAPGEKVKERELKAVHDLKEKVIKLASVHFQADPDALKHQIAFDKERSTSISYLSSWDRRGMWGWQKVDGTIQNLVKLLHQNPHLYHWGESCEGHIFEPTPWRPEPELSRGFIAIGIDGTEESREIIAKIKMIADANDYMKITESKTIFGVEVYHIRMGTEFLSEEKQKMRTLEEHKQEYDKLWKALEAVLAESAKGYEPINWNNEYSKGLHLTF